MKLIFEWDFENYLKLTDDQVNSNYVREYDHSEFLNSELVGEIHDWAEDYSKYAAMNFEELKNYQKEFEKLDNDAKVLTQKISASVFQRDNKITSVEYFSLCADVVLIRIEKSV
ncbi:MAG: hypothetical protein JXR53_02035 [Bacteroidales bacterium]|nr:hypothetical protein [Bacteroidales bacterium]